MRKSEALSHWRQLPEGQNPLRHMEAIPYKATGSRYGACGIRVDGSPEFVDAVLSCLKPLLSGENAVTRLELSRQPVKHENPMSGKAYHNAAKAAEVCYIRLHMRGREAAMTNAFLGVIGMGREATEEATRLFAEAQGVAE